MIISFNNLFKIFFINDFEYFISVFYMIMRYVNIRFIFIIVFIVIGFIDDILTFFCILFYKEDRRIVKNFMMFKRS